MGTRMAVSPYCFWLSDPRQVCSEARGRERDRGVKKECRRRQQFPPSQAHRVRLLIRLPFQDRVELTRQVLQPHKRLKPKRTFYSIFLWFSTKNNRNCVITSTAGQKLRKTISARPGGWRGWGEWNALTHSSPLLPASLERHRGLHRIYVKFNRRALHQLFAHVDMTHLNRCKRVVR